MIFNRRMDKKAQKSAEKQDILKPCPLCENRNIKIFTAMGTSISCEKCNLKLYDLDRETAIKRWNTRTKSSTKEIWGLWDSTGPFSENYSVSDRI